MPATHMLSSQQFIGSQVISGEAEEAGDLNSNYGTHKTTKKTAPPNI